jgi:hypothetical protein
LQSKKREPFFTMNVEGEVIRKSRLTRRPNGFLVLVHKTVGIAGPPIERVSKQKIVVTIKAARTVTVVHRDDPQHPITLILSDDAAKSAENNIELLPGDTVAVSRAGIVYVVGPCARRYLVPDTSSPRRFSCARNFGSARRPR